MRCALGIVPILLFASLCLAVQPDRINGTIDSYHPVILPGSVHAKAQPQYDQGPVEASFHLPYITMVMQPSAQQQADLQQLLEQQQHPTSPNYHKWLTPEQYGDRFGISQNDMQKISTWLRSQGFSIVQAARGRDWIAFSGTAALVESTFHTQIHYFNVDGEQHFANATEISIPQALAGVVVGFRGVNDFGLKPIGITEPGPADFFPLVLRPSYDLNGQHFLAPDDIATIYDITSLYNSNINGTGMKMVVVGQVDVSGSLSDIDNFRSAFGLSKNDPQQTIVPGSPNPGTASGDMIESKLDLEWSGAVARDATILFITAATTFGGVGTAAQYAIDQDLAPVISMSYGGCEAENVSFIPGNEVVQQQANTEGITFVASSGDTGAAGCDADTAAVATQGLGVNYPASSPEVTGVGGNEFNEGSGNYWNSSNGANGGSAISYIPEVAWNDTASRGTLSASGGGASSCAQGSGNTCTAGFAKPAWQTGTGVPKDGVRDVPDVALTASPDHDGYIICDAAAGDGCTGGVVGSSPVIVGGTSASTPVFAGIVTLLNQFTESKGLGNINPTLYQLAQNPSSGIFHDVTSGNNIVPCTPGTPSTAPTALRCPGSGSFGYSAGVGYDQVTGVGSVDSDGLIRAVNSTIAVSPQEITTVGSSGPVSLTATVKAAWGTATPTGTVTFYNGSTAISPAVTLSNGSGTYPSYNPSGLTAGIYPITALYSGDATYKSSTSPAADLTVGTATTTTLSLSPSSLNVGAAGPVALSGTVAPNSGNGTPTGTVTFFNGTTQIGSPASLKNGAASLNYNPASLAGGTYSITAQYSGDTSFVSSTSAPQSLNVLDFSIAANPTTVTIGAPGQSGSTTITITDLGGFSQSLAFSCSGLPSEATCTFASASATSESLTITTTAATAKLQHGPRTIRAVVFAMLFPGLFGWVLLPAGGRARARRQLRLILLVGILALSIAWIGCGGGGSTTPSNPGTPAGNSTVTITAASSGANVVTHKITITLDVQ